jgi:hypothetical protein
VSTFAKNTLGVAAVKNDFGSAAIDMLKIPWVYGWSEGVLGRPEDWVDHIGMSLGAFREGRRFANRLQTCQGSSCRRTHRMPM